METGIKETVKNVLSAMQPRSPENMIISQTDLEAERQTREDQAEKSSNLGGVRARDEFKRDKFVPNARTQAPFDFCVNFNPTTDNGYFFGKTGTGKSHLAIIAARKFWRRATVVKPCEIFRSIRACREAYDEISVIGDYARAQVLVIDDLGVGRDTEFAVTSLYEIMDKRYQSMAGGLIVTSNLSISQLAAKLGDDRITSRLAHMCRGHIFELHEKDWRTS